MRGVLGCDVALDMGKPGNVEGCRTDRFRGYHDSMGLSSAARREPALGYQGAAKLIAIGLVTVGCTLMGLRKQESA